MYTVFFICLDVQHVCIFGFWYLFALAFVVSVWRAAFHLSVGTFVCQNSIWGGGGVVYLAHAQMFVSGRKDRANINTSQYLIKSLNLHTTCELVFLCDVELSTMGFFNGP